MTQAALGQIEVEGERYGLTLVRRLAARIQDVWEAITEPEELEEWLSTTELEPRSGGRIQIDFGDNDVVRGTVQKFDPPHVFEFTWSDPKDGNDPSVVRFELTQDGDETVLRFTHRRQLDHLARSTAAGWHAHLDLLEGRLRGESIRFEDRYGKLKPLYEPIIAELIS
jgi:uncharacterized protein YndB with AHSA1/START domain